MERSSSITWTSMQYVYFKMEKYCGYFLKEKKKRSTKAISFIAQ